MFKGAHLLSGKPTPWPVQHCPSVCSSANAKQWNVHGISMTPRISHPGIGLEFFANEILKSHRWNTTIPGLYKPVCSDCVTMTWLHIILQQFEALEGIGTIATGEWNRLWSIPTQPHSWVKCMLCLCHSPTLLLVYSSYVLEKTPKRQEWSDKQGYVQT